MKQGVARLVFTGDILCHREQLAACRTSSGYEFHPVFGEVSGLLSDADFRIGNLESPFAGEEAGYSSALYSFNTPDSFLDALKDTGFELVSTANNHCLDRGLSGLKRTLDALDRAGLAHTGTARSAGERDGLCLREINGIRVAFLSYTYGTNAFANHVFLKEEESWAVNLFQPQETLPGSIHLLDSPERIRENMRKNRTEESSSVYLERLREDIRSSRSAGADFVIVLMHSGGQYNRLPDPYTEFLVGKIREFGADLIVGNHPHVVQRAVPEGRCPVFYSLGNFACTPGDSPESLRNPIGLTSLLLYVGLEKGESGTAVASLWYRITKSVLREDGVSVPRPFRDLLSEESDPEKRAQLLDELRIVVNCFRDRPLSLPVEEAEEYSLL